MSQHKCYLFSISYSVEVFSSLVFSLTFGANKGVGSTKGMWIKRFLSYAGHCGRSFHLMFRIDVIVGGCKFMTADKKK